MVGIYYVMYELAIDFSSVEYKAILFLPFIVVQSSVGVQFFESSDD